ncbi:MAG: OmpA family protein [Dysgonamonadaceae bacterium]|jgi:peptidoglycan-associated lipoprotein|nr:OmpA family protein [Dysgonamonadaceae bacterium]
MLKKILFPLSLLAFLLLFSCKSAKLSDAVAKQEKGEYYDAAQIYRKVYGKTSSKKRYLRGAIAFQMGECFRETNNSQRALGAYQNSIRYEYPDSISILHSAQMLQHLGKYTDATKRYQEFLTLNPNSVLAQNGIAGCEASIEWNKNPIRYAVKRMDKLNSREGEFSPMLSGDKHDELYFTSSRKGATGDEKSGITGQKNNDLFLVKQNEKGEWLKPEAIESELNTEFDEGTPSFPETGSTMYYTFCSEDEATPRTAEIYKSSRSGAKWGPGEKVEIFKDSTIMTAHPAVSPDEMYLYFASDALGGYGGKDIWRIPVRDIGSSYPENLGPEINTPGDETFPYVRNDNVIYFASNGHPGMGGLDLFKAVYNSKTEKWRIENMKSPINSMGDDFGITFAGDEEKGYFSSNRNDGKGLDHIYSFELPKITVMVEGWVLDRDEEIISGASVRIVGKDGTNVRHQARNDGTYFMEVTPGMEYTMMGSAQGHLNEKQSLVVSTEEKSQIFYVDFYLPSISKPVLIENIFYAFNKATLRPESKEALDELITMLNDNPNVTIELSAHTDRKGSEKYNQDLSQRRAQSVVDYLIRGGIDKERLTAVGYSKTKPQTVSKKVAEKYDFLPEGQLLNEEFIGTLMPEQQDIADQINRRTEFMVLSTTYRLQ